MRLLQICANVKSRPVRQDQRDAEQKYRRLLDKAFNFSMLRRFCFLILQHIKQNARADLEERTAVSTMFSTEDRATEVKKRGPPNAPQVRKNRGFPRFYFAVSTSKSASLGSDSSWTSKEPDGEHEDGAEETQNTVDGDSHKAERQRQQPDERIKHQSQQREWPTQDEQDDPQEESSHSDLACGGRKAIIVNDPEKPPASILHYERERGKVSSTAYSFSLKRLATDAGTSASRHMCKSSISECRTRPSA